MPSSLTRGIAGPARPLQALRGNAFKTIHLRDKKLARIKAEIRRAAAGKAFKKWMARWKK